MKASELRIGNLFKDAKDRLCSVDEIYKNIEDCRITSIFDCITSHPIKPIPLTEEWLLKFGFIYTKTELGFNQFRKGILELSITTNGYELFFTYKWIEIEYVHQLQNLYFALTNEELTLKQN